MSHRSVTQAPLHLGPVRRESTVGLIADVLRSAIRTGDLAPGTSLVEGVLAAQLGVSRGPLREAAQRLVAEGLLVSAWHRRLTVPHPAPEDVRDLYATREALEGTAWSATLARRRPGAAERLDEICTRMSSAARDGDRERLAEDDHCFHEQLAVESGSPRLRRLLATLLLETRLAQQSVVPVAGSSHHTPDLHVGMVEALRRGDERTLLRLSSQHMREAAARLAPVRR